MGELARLASEPSAHQRKLWWEFIAIKDEPVLGENGMFMWMGWCPLCDDERSDAIITARFDFRRGLLYCDKDEDGEACFKQRCLSLTNVLIRLGGKSG